MLLSSLNIALAVALVASAIWTLIYIRKKGVPVGKPFLLGLASMAAGYFGAALLLLAVSGFAGGPEGDAFIEGKAAAFVLALTSATLVTLAMFFMLKKPLAQRRSAHETLAFGIGVVLPMLVYRAVGVVAAGAQYLLAGVGYGASALLLAESAVGLALMLCEAVLSLLLAHMLNRNRAFMGFLATLACELAVYAGLSLADAFGAPAAVGPAVGLVVLACVAVYDARAWSSFPPVKRQTRSRGTGKNISWPEPGEDGR